MVTHWQRPCRMCRCEGLWIYCTLTWLTLLFHFFFYTHLFSHFPPPLAKLSLSLSLSVSPGVSIRLSGSLSCTITVWTDPPFLHKLTLRRWCAYRCCWAVQERTLYTLLADIHQITHNVNNLLHLTVWCNFFIFS